MKKIFLIALALVGGLLCQAQGKKEIILPVANTEGGKPFMETLKDRHTTRSFSEEKLSDQQLSNLLWAAFGINRPESGKRTAPSAMNNQETDIYVCLSSGVFLYDAKKHSLILVVEEDYRKNMGRQDFVASAPVILLFVADYSKMGEKVSAEKKDFYSAVDVGYISQNVYLYCASENLGTVVLGSV
ncbi:MAG TPA: SagB/ThcOx family dehydrogenase, partial [Bacteroidales bacterium]|nr:SagB/ThcOx family dehydrogenase [Bacteroidales bacterium]